jgi:hypothetical protein
MCVMQGIKRPIGFLHTQDATCLSRDTRLHQYLIVATAVTDGSGNAAAAAASSSLVFINHQNAEGAAPLSILSRAISKYRTFLIFPFTHN